MEIKNHRAGETFTDHFDRLVLATGADPIRPKIGGIELGNVFYLRSIFDADAFSQQIRSDSVRNVVIAGGGYIGLEMAESLVHLGKNVAIVELAPPDFNSPR
jgi:NADPH-dependent 2,4-dienoyl-CoA reductase/sulfur reductase-like enzyme